LINLLDLQNRSQCSNDYLQLHRRVDIRQTIRHDFIERVPSITGEGQVKALACRARSGSSRLIELRGQEFRESDVTGVRSQHKKLRAAQLIDLLYVGYCAQGG